MSTDRLTIESVRRAFPPIAVGFLLIAWAGEGVSGAAPAGSEKAVEVAAPASPEALRSLIRQLDSEQYAVRQRAADRLRELARRPETASALAQEVQRVLHAADTSFEVRRALESLSAHLPPATEALPPAVNAEEIDRLVRQLEHDDFGRRAAARRRLEWLAGHPELVCPILLSVKARLDTEGLPVDARRWIEPVYKQTRRAWLTSDPKRWALPPLSEAQIARWIDDLVRPVDEGQGARTEPGPERAMRELSDAMARDEYTARIQQALEARLARPGLDGRAASRIRRLLDLTRPAMAAECWGRLAPTMPTRLVGTQSLIVGEPSLGPGAERPSHFDRIDDHTAHCVSGQNLAPGDYPVGVAFPHPKQPGYFFHLVNLTTPRRKMANQYVVEMPAAKRLAELSRRTFAWMLARAKPLSISELNMLRQLDRDELSRFAGPFLAMVQDELVPEAEYGAVPEPLLQIAPPAESPRISKGHAGRPSRHGVLCELLATHGTREALPGLARAIESRRVLPPTERAPYRLDAIALLAIAARESSPESDAWLARWLDRPDPLVAGADQAPALGASAGALLLKRHGRSPLDFGLVEADDPFLAGVGVAGHRAASADALDRLRQWWAGRKEKPDGA